MSIQRIQKFLLRDETDESQITNEKIQGSTSFKLNCKNSKIFISKF